MKKFTQLYDPISKLNDIEDYLLELTDIGFLSIAAKPYLKLVDIDGKYTYRITSVYNIGFKKYIDKLEALKDQIGGLNKLHNSLMRCSTHFTIIGNSLSINIDPGEKLNALLNKYNIQGGRGFKLPIPSMDIICSYNVEIRDDHSIYLLVGGITKQNSEEKTKEVLYLRTALIDLLSDYGFKFVDNPVSDWSINKTWCFKLT